MAKRIYNYEIFTHKRDKLMEIRKQRNRARRMKIALAAAALVLAVLVIYLINGSRCRYYVYKNVSEGEENINVSYEKFASGYIKYSNNGIEYQRSLGDSEWNSPDSYTHPFVELSDQYVLFGDKGANSLKLFDREGEVYSFSLKYPLAQASVSNGGYIEVVLRGDSGNFIQVYDKEGALVADMKSSVDETGYPLTAAISPNGNLLAVSYYKLNGMQSGSSLVFYDLRGDASRDIAAGFEYGDLMIPKLNFLDSDSMAAFGDGEIILYDTGNRPSEKKRLKYDKTMESVFTGGKSFGLVLDNTEEEDGGRHIIKLYNKNGREKLSRDIDMNYSRIRMWGNEIYAFNDSECMIMSTSGKLAWQGELEGNTIEAVIPIPGWRTYKVVFRDKTVDMHLRFWKFDDTTTENERH